MGRNHEHQDAQTAEPTSQAQMLVDLVANPELNIKLFHTPDEQAHASVPQGSGSLAIPLTSGAFRRYLSLAYRSAFGGVPSRKAVDDAVNTLAAEAIYDGPQMEVFTRTAEHQGRVYLDLADGQGTVIEIGTEDWRVAKNVPVQFVRPRTMLALPMPRRGGSKDLLARYINVAPDDLVLVVGWLISALTPGHGAKPVLGLHGEQGSAKSTTTRVLKRLIDPTQSELRAEPRSLQDLMVAASNEWLPSWDNLSHLKDWQSDAMCRISTGASSATRQLYTDLDEIVIQAKRPQIVNGITEVATRPDLLQRSIVLQLPTISEERRQTEEEFWDSFEQDWPQMLGFLLDGLSGALRMLPSVHLPRKPRMSDFAVLATAAEEALGFNAGDFMAAYTRNADDTNGLVLESSPVAQALFELLEQTPTWQGTATELLGVLNAIDAETRMTGFLPLAADWPKNGRALSMTLKRLATVLRAEGIEIEADRSGKRRDIIVRRLKPA